MNVGIDFTMISVFFICVAVRVSKTASIIFNGLLLVNLVGALGRSKF